MAKLRLNLAYNDLGRGVTPFDKFELVEIQVFVPKSSLEACKESAEAASVLGRTIGTAIHDELNRVDG